MKKRSGFMVMLKLIKLVKPLIGIMTLAIIMGCIGNLAATFITILGGYGILSVLGLYDGMSLGNICTILLMLAVVRGGLRYAEQASNHYIAFKLLARIRNLVFASLRRLAPAKTDGAEKGNMISIITSDIELLEVFYAHTISPIVIAFITSVVMCMFMGMQGIKYAMVAAAFYIIVGIIIPLVNGRLGRGLGQEYRRKFGILNGTVLDNLYGLREILQFGLAEKRIHIMNKQTEDMENINRELKSKENVQRMITDAVVLIAGVTMVIISNNFKESVIAVIAMISSFGPVIALSALSNNLNQTLASGDRVLNILEEEPITEDITNGSNQVDMNINFDNVTFAYGDVKEKKEVLNNFSHYFESGKIHGIFGKSGCGKSTTLKLLMRFYETDKGAVCYGDRNVNDINTHELRNKTAYVTQETFLFHDTIANNIRVAKEEASQEEVIEAAKKASIHDFIMTLPEKYETKVAEAGASLSGGEKQRIGLARAFLHDSELILLDEPTSNIDSLNEGIILKSLKQEKGNKTIILVSHRKSTMGIVECEVSM